MADQFKYAQLQNFSLAGAGAVAAATSVILKSFKTIDGVALTMTNFGVIGYGTLEPGNGTLEEQISFSGVTQNANGTATLTGVKSVLFIAPYTESSGLAKTHAGNTTFIISNTAGYYDKLTSKLDDETITGDWNFQTVSPVTADVTSSDTTRAANVAYVNSVVTSGAPNASTTTKGLVQEATVAQINSGTGSGSTGAKLFASPADLASSIYGIQLPSSGQKDALVGTSGTPGTSNKYVTNSDTAVTSTANAVVRANASGLIDSSFLSSEFTAYLAAESITAGNALATGYYQADGGIIFDTKIGGSQSINGTAGWTSGSLTLANQPNRMLLVVINNPNNITMSVNSVTWSIGPQSLASAQAATAANVSTNIWFIANPTVGTGTINVNVSTGSAITVSFEVYEYYGVSSTLGQKFSTTGTTSLISKTITPGVDLPVIFSSAVSNSGIASSINLSSHPSANLNAGDSGVIFPKKANTYTVAPVGVSAQIAMVNIELKPATVPTFGYVRKASSAAVTNPDESNKYDAFIGFATANASTGQSVVVQLAGRNTNQSGLTIGAQYYLNDTVGTIGTTPGTVTRKVAIAQTATELSITNNW